jgi:hypothetical protein
MAEGADAVDEALGPLQALGRGQAQHPEDEVVIVRPLLRERVLDGRGYRLFLSFQKECRIVRTRHGSPW